MLDNELRLAAQIKWLKMEHAKAGSSLKQNKELISSLMLLGGRVSRSGLGCPTEHILDGP